MQVAAQNGMRIPLLIDTGLLILGLIVATQMYDAVHGLEQKVAALQTSQDKRAEVLDLIRISQARIETKLERLSQDIDELKQSRKK